MARQKQDVQPRYMRYSQCCIRYGLGLNTMRKLAEDAQAVFCVGRARIIDTELIDSYLQQMQAGRNEVNA